MPLDDKIAALRAADEEARATFLKAVSSARDAYVQERHAFAEGEERWLHDPSDDAARAAARDGWQALSAARKALTDASTAAGTARAAALDAAWAEIKAR